MEPFTLALEDDVGFGKASEIGRSDVGARVRSTPLTFEPGDGRVRRKGILGVCPAETTVVKAQVGEGGSQQAIDVVEMGDIDASRIGGVDSGADRGGPPFVLLGGQNPFPDGGRSIFAGEKSKPIESDSSPLGDDPVDRSVGPGAYCRQYGIDVENLTAADRLGSPALTQNEAIAGQQRNSSFEMKANAGAGAGSDSLSAEDAYSRWDLVRADVHGEGTSTAHGVIQSFENIESGVGSVADVPLLRSDHRVPAHDRRVVHARQVERDSVARTDRLVLLAKRLNRADASELHRRGDGDGVADVERTVSESSCDHGAASLCCEDAIDEKARQIPVR